MFLNTRPAKSISAALLALALAVPTVACAAAPATGYTIVAKYPHSTESYTEGFFYLDGLFYEGTGIAGHSALLAIPAGNRQTHPETRAPPRIFR